MATFLVLVVLIAALVLAARSVIHHKKNGECAGGCSGCSGCSHCDSCH